MRVQTQLERRSDARRFLDGRRIDRGCRGLKADRNSVGDCQRVGEKEPGAARVIGRSVLIGRQAYEAKRMLESWTSELLAARTKLGNMRVQTQLERRSDARRFLDGRRIDRGCRGLKADWNSVGDCQRVGGKELLSCTGDRALGLDRTAGVA